MIAYIKGKILEKGINFAILENNGLGYKVFTIPEILEKPEGAEVALYTYLKAGEDGQTLFGLANFRDLEFFELLITVSGVGPKMALSILSASKREAVEQAIINQDSAIFTRVSGVGKKTAERIILELKTKINAGTMGESGLGSSDVFDALIKLGYNPREVREVITKLDAQAPEQEQLKQALKLLS